MTELAFLQTEHSLSLFTNHKTMDIKKIIPVLGIVLGLSPGVLLAQIVSIDRQVVASTGYDTLLVSGFQYSYTVGELATATKTEDDDFYITEGFHQPDGPLLAPVVFSTTSSEAQCPDVADGTITVVPDGCTAPYSIELAGNNGDTVFVDDIDEKYIFMNLDSGSYRITVRGFTLCSKRDTVQIRFKNKDCNVKLYTGITPNGDGKNDFWEIDNIEINQPNEVQIFNRWGSKIWSGSNYDNRNVVWQGDNNGGQQLPSGTYFYTIKVSGNSDASGSGWIQLTR